MLNHIEKFIDFQKPCYEIAITRLYRTDYILPIFAYLISKYILWTLIYSELWYREDNFMSTQVIMAHRKNIVLENWCPRIVDLTKNSTLKAVFFLKDWTPENGISRTGIATWMLPSCIYEAMGNVNPPGKDLWYFIGNWCGCAHSPQILLHASSTCF